MFYLFMLYIYDMLDILLYFTVHDVPNDIYILKRQLLGPWIGLAKATSFFGAKITLRIQQKAPNVMAGQPTPPGPRTPPPQK